MADFPFHPLADLFPLLEGAEFEQLVVDIRQHGLRESVVLLDGMILDGRNRYRACQGAGVPVRATLFEGRDPVAFVISANLRRRHLNEGQRAMVAAKLANLPAHRPPEGKSANLPTFFPAPQTQTPVAPVSQPDAARLLNVSERSVRHAAVVRDHAVPELAAKVERGALGVSTAADVARLPDKEQREAVAAGDQELARKAKEARERKTAAKRAANDELKAATVAHVPPGRYGTIVVDPPWNMQKIERDVRPNQVAFDYPTMSEGELAAFPLPDMAADDCHLFCWTTQKFLPSALRLIELWGFRYVLTMVWHKAGGFQPIGLPQYNCEFVIYGRRGTPVFGDTKAFPCCFAGARREHGRKPSEFYDLIRRVTAAGRIDVFSRGPHDGFAQYGNEANKFGSVP